MNKIEEANIPTEELAELTEMINSCSWRTAKSTNYPPELMHQYIVNSWGTQYQTAVVKLKEAISKYGFDDDFFGQPHRYLVIGDYKYWNYNILVNREVKNLYQLRLDLIEARKLAKEAKKKNDNPVLF